MKSKKEVDNTILELIISEIDNNEQKLDINDYIKLINSNNKIEEAMENKVSTFETNDENELIIPKTITNTVLLELITAYCIEKNIDIKEEDNNYNLIEPEYISDDTKIYLNEISKIPLLSKEEEYNLAILVKQGDKEAKRRFVESNLKLVVSIARNYVGKGMDFMDLIQEGNLGLLRAIEDFDPFKGYKFSTYATHWINCLIRRAIANKSKDIRIPVYVLTNINKINYIKTEFYKQNACYPTEEELSIKLNLPIEKIKEILKSTQEVVSLDAPVSEEDDFTLGDTISNNDFFNIEKINFNKLLKEEINEALKHLPIREQRIIKLRFGLEDGIPRTLEEISKENCVTTERIRQLEAKALRRLRTPVIGRKLREYLD